jgi:hypothetical protein
VKPFPVDGDRTWDPEALALAGYCSSYREHDAWQSAASLRAVSAVKALNMADDDPGATGNEVVFLEPGPDVEAVVDAALDLLDADKAAIVAFLGTDPDSERKAWATKKEVTFVGAAMSWTGGRTSWPVRTGRRAT